MDRFASCYFCGDAFDASLSEYPVVPKELQPAEDGPKVVLCGACRRKLGAVIESVVTATQDGSAADAGTAPRRDEPAGTAATTEPAESAGGSLREANADTETPSNVADETTTAADEWDSPTSDDSADETTTTGDDGDTAATTASDETTGDGAEPTLTKLEYNKVMRLLQNRPFPVDRGEIREVATSAYDIDPAEFDAVIEAAVERDLVAVEDGQFVDPA